MRYYNAQKRRIIFPGRSKGNAGHPPKAFETITRRTAPNTGSIRKNTRRRKGVGSPSTSRDKSHASFFLYKRGYTYGSTNVDCTHTEITHSSKTIICKRFTEARFGSCLSSLRVVDHPFFPSDEGAGLVNIIEDNFTGCQLHKRNISIRYLFYVLHECPKTIPVGNNQYIFSFDKFWQNC